MVLSETEKDTIAAVYRRLGEGVAHFRPRKQQRHLVAFVANSVASGRIGIAEAPTAVGKSLGYLVPAVTLALLRKVPCVVSTGTVVLQRQIFDKDLPTVMAAVAGVTGTEPRCSILKGRGRYICPIRLYDKGLDGDLFANAEESNAAGTLVSEHRAGRWSGDIDSSPIAISPELWKTIRNDHRSCLGVRCPQFATCPYFLDVEAAKASDVVITNHDMLLNSVAATNDSASGLPPLAQMHVIFDEAHHLPDKALSVFAESFSLQTSWTEAVPELIRKLDRLMAQSAAIECATLARHAKSMSRAAQVLCTDGGNVLRIHDEMPATLAVPAGKILESLERMRNTLELIVEVASKKSNGGLLATEKMRANSLARRLGEMAAAIESFLQPNPEREARWIECDGNRVSPTWTGNISPFSSGRILANKLWAHVASACCVSATLAPCGSLEPTLIRLGLKGDSRVDTLTLDSPLDYSKSEIVIPPLRTTPSDIDAHTDEVIALLESLDLYVGGVLTLFSSRKQMELASERLSPELRRIVLMQGAKTTDDILRTHGARVRNGFPSVLFGLQSFGEGIDLPGDLCTTVIIAKIPFPAMHEPVLAAEADFLKRKGKEPFALLFVPAASMVLRQNVGRLVRRESDSGTVYIMDDRLRTRGYGRALLRGMPMAVRFGPPRSDRLRARLPLTPASPASDGIP